MDYDKQEAKEVVLKIEEGSNFRVELSDRTGRTQGEKETKKRREEKS